MDAHVLFTAVAALMLGSSTAAVTAHPPNEIPSPTGAPIAIVREAPASAFVARTHQITASANLIWAADVATIVVTQPPERREPTTVRSTARRHSYTFTVSIVGHQSALDRCAGFVWEQFGASGTVVSAHNRCGGAVILALKVGDRVTLKDHGAGRYEVTQIKAVARGTNSRVLKGQLWMQTCYLGKPMLRLVRLTPVN